MFNFMVLGLGVGSIEMIFIGFVPFRSHDGLAVLYHIPTGDNEEMTDIFPSKGMIK